jgi:hypothetical protein
MQDTRVVISVDQKDELVSLVRRLPSILSGRVPDEQGIAKGFRARLGFTLLSLIAPNFEELSRGQSGADGEKWKPLSREYLAYGRRFNKGEEGKLKKAAGVDPRHARYAPGDRKGLLTTDQLKLWRKTFVQHLARLQMRMDQEEAKGIAAAIAWNKVKAMGAKTKLEVYGARQAQILVDTGRLRGSLLPGQLHENGSYAEYVTPSGLGATDQIFEADEPYKIVVGTNVKYAVYHHAAKDPRKRRRLWPRNIPDDWWGQMMGAAVSGLQRIVELFKYGA